MASCRSPPHLCNSSTASCLEKPASTISWMEDSSRITTSLDAEEDWADCEGLGRLDTAKHKIEQMMSINWC